MNLILMPCSSKQISESWSLGTASRLPRRPPRKRKSFHLWVLQLPHLPTAIIAVKTNNIEAKDNLCRLSVRAAMGYKMTTVRVRVTSWVWRHASAYTQSKCPRISWEKGRTQGDLWAKLIGKLAIKKVSRDKERFALKQHPQALPFLLTVFGVDGIIRV